MTTLQIEHAITGFDTWKAAFDRFADQRANAGVTAHRLSQPVGDDRYIVVELDFEGAAQAQAFEQFLRSEVWSTPERSPGLSGAPTTRMLQAAPQQ